MPTDPITVRVVCDHCEGIGTNAWDGLVCARCNGDKTMRATLDPSSRDAAQIALAGAVDAMSKAMSANPFTENDARRFGEANDAVKAALAAVRQHPDYKGGA
jgi:DnaJ-class molecular chaperone